MKDHVPRYGVRGVPTSGPRPLRPLDQAPGCGAHVATLCLRVISCGFLFYAYGMVITQSFNGAGDTWTSALINVGCFWLFELPLAYLLARPAGLGPWGVALAVTIAFSMIALVSALIFRRGRWKLRRV